MTSDDHNRDEKLQYINREAAKISAYHQTNFVSMNVLLVKEYYHLIKNKKQTKLNLLIFL